MKRWTKVSIWAAAFIIGLGMGIFLIQQGLDQAALWATVLGLPVAVIGTLAGVWSFVLAAKTIRESRQHPPGATTSLKKANAELIDASIDPSIRTTLTSSTGHTLSVPEQRYAISDIEPGYEAIDFKFVNSGDATAVLHKFSLEILECRLDLTPVLAYSYNRPPSMAHGADATNSSGTSLEVQVNNNGWGDATQFTAYMTNPILNKLLPPSKLSFSCAAVTSGGKATFALQVEDIDLQALTQLKIQRKATQSKTLSAMASVDMTVLEDEDFNLFLSNLERWHVREFLMYSRSGMSGLQSHRDYIAGSGNEYLPIRLDMEVRYLDRYGSHQSVKTVAQSVPAGLTNMTSKSGSERMDLDDLVKEGVLWIGAKSFRFDRYVVSAEAMETTEVYSVILDPESSKRDYKISRSIAPGEADRFHILLVPSKSGTFTLRLSFNVNRTDLVTSDPISVSLERLRNAPLPPRLMDGASFHLRDGRLELGGEPKWPKPDAW